MSRTVERLLPLLVTALTLAPVAPRADLSPAEDATLRHWLEAGAADAGAAR